LKDQKGPGIPDLNCLQTEIEVVKFKNLFDQKRYCRSVSGRYSTHK